jgi:hypothetical protein
MINRKDRPSLSRAEAVRQRRNQTQQPQRQPLIPRTKAAPRPVQRAATMPAHTSRYSAPVTQKSSYRKVYYKVGTNGVETRMPSVPVVHLNWQWLSGGMTMVLFILVIMLTSLPTFKINSISVEGLKRLTSSDIAPIIQASSESIFTFDRNKTIDAIAIAFPELTNIHLKVNFSGGLNLTVDERQPILAWTTGDQTIWVDSEGVVMPPRGDAGVLLNVASNDTTPLANPVTAPKSALDYAVMVINRQEMPLTPEEAMNTLDPKVLKAALDLSVQMPQGATLVFDSISGMGWQDPRGWKVFFGTSLENIQFKQLEYQAIVDRLGQMGISPTTISVEHIDAPYYRTE